jgi:predicted membrane channel-forming protein YqfA (hemolysin III family)
VIVLPNMVLRLFASLLTRQAPSGTTAALYMCFHTCSIRFGTFMARKYDSTVWIALYKAVVLLGVASLFYWLPASKLAQGPGPLGGIAGLFLRGSRVCTIKYLCN